MTVSQAYPKLRPTQMKCLTDNVYYEARGEPPKGQMLVARVTLNRAKEEFNGDICKAVYAPYQFSWTLTKQAKPNYEVYSQAAKAAYASLYYYKPVYYFHNKYIKPDWAYTKTKFASVGNHIFYQ
jgi:N-acetylmuramoyl-L-alanine amidase